MADRGRSPRRGDQVRPRRDLETGYVPNAVLVVRKLSRSRWCRCCGKSLPGRTIAAVNASEGALCVEHVEALDA